MNAQKTYQTIKLFNLPDSEIIRLIDMLQDDVRNTEIKSDIEDSEDMQMADYMIKVLKIKDQAFINSYKNQVRKMVLKESNV